VGWKTRFPGYQVDPSIERLVEAGYIRDTSGPFDPAPSFSAMLHGRRWLRLWVEHPEYPRRRAGPKRYRLEVTRSLREEGRPWIETDELHAVLPYLMMAIEDEGFRLAGIA
jgi:hypothetical protein